MMFLWTGVFVTALVATESPSRVGQSLDALELCQRVSNERMKISSAIVEVTTKTEWPNRPERVRRYRWCLDEERLRSDVQQSLIRHWSNGRSASAESTIRVVYDATEVLLYDDVRSPGENGVAAYKVNTTNREGVQFLGAVQPYKVDPRKIGLIPRDQGLFYRFEPNHFLAPDDPEKVNRSPDVIDNVDVVKIEFEKGRMPVTLWIDEARGPSLVAAETEQPYKGGVLRDSIAVELAQYGEFWYPGVVEYERKHDGELLQRSVLKVTSAEFNIDLPPNTFTLAGLGLPIGKMVREIPAPPGPVRQWDGKQLVVLEPGIDRRPLEVSESAQSRFWLIGINLIIIGVLVALIALRRR